MLSSKQIILLLERLAEKTVCQFDGYRVVRRALGYSDDPEVSKIQTMLSIMLQVAVEREREAPDGE